MSQTGLISSDDSVLIVIDAQPSFLAKLPPEAHRLLMQHICWLVGVANWLHIPVVVTAEDLDREGSIDDQLAQTLPPTTAIHNKMTFALTAEPQILGAVRATRRQTAVLVGLETDVCVAQSALGLMELGFQVVVVADGTGAPGTAHEYGLARIRDAGAHVLGSKGLLYEWVRTVAEADRFMRECAGLPVPEDLIL